MQGLDGPRGQYDAATLEAAKRAQQSGWPTREALAAGDLQVVPKPVDLPLLLRLVDERVHLRLCQLRRVDGAAPNAKRIWPEVGTGGTTEAFDGFLVHSRGAIGLGLAAPGKYADITVLSKDILKVPEDEIPTAKVTLLATDAINFAPRFSPDGKWILFHRPKTEFGGSQDLGTVFAMHRDGATLQVLHAFGGTDGSRPRAPIAIWPSAASLSDRRSCASRSCTWSPRATG